jgi:hypothetical protein
MGVVISKRRPIIGRQGRKGIYPLDGIVLLRPLAVKTLADGMA